MYHGHLVDAAAESTCAKQINYWTLAKNSQSLSNSMIVKK
jgi:hypothetical protein